MGARLSSLRTSPKPGGSTRRSQPRFMSRISKASLTSPGRDRGKIFGELYDEIFNEEITAEA